MRDFKLFASVIASGFEVKLAYLSGVSMRDTGAICRLDLSCPIQGIG